MPPPLPRSPRRGYRVPSPRSGRSTAASSEGGRPVAVPEGWKRAESRRYPGCSYYITDTGEATWVLPGQSGKKIKSGIVSLYQQDFVNDPVQVATVNPKAANCATVRLSSYGVHPKAAKARDAETYLSLKQHDFKGETQPKWQRPPPPPRFVRPFDTNSSYRANYVEFPIDGFPLRGLTREEPGDRTAGAVDVEALTEAEIAEATAKPNVYRRSKHPTEQLRDAEALLDKIVAERHRKRGAAEGGEEGSRCRSAVSSRAATPKASPSPCAVSPAPPGTNRPASASVAARRPYQARPKDMAQGRMLPFTSTTDYRTNFIDFRPPRPHLAHPPDQIDFGPRVGDNGEHPNSLYRETYAGEPPVQGRARKSCVHARMLNIPGGYKSNNAIDYTEDADMPDPTFRERMRKSDRQVVSRCKLTTSLGEGY